MVKMSNREVESGTLFEHAERPEKLARNNTIQNEAPLWDIFIVASGAGGQRHVGAGRNEFRPAHELYHVLVPAGIGWERAGCQNVSSGRSWRRNTFDGRSKDDDVESGDKKRITGQYHR
jgi:hypothetical protein